MDENKGEDQSPRSQKGIKKYFILTIHWAIILNFLFEIVYAAYMVFYVIKPEGHSGPLASAAKEIPHELMVTRRLYAIEFWIAFAGLAIYLALTEFSPYFHSRESRHKKD